VGVFDGLEREVIRRFDPKYVSKTVGAKGLPALLGGRQLKWNRIHELEFPAPSTGDLEWVWHTTIVEQ
jgi:hypothetical protein